MKFSEKQINELKAKNLLETAEIVSCVGDLLVLGGEALENDGKISIPEMTMIGWEMADSVKAAIKNFKQVYESEIKEIDSSDIKSLGEIIFPALQESQSAFCFELTKKLVNIASDLVFIVNLWQNKENWNTPVQAKEVE